MIKIQFLKSSVIQLSRILNFFVFWVDFKSSLMKFYEQIINSKSKVYCRDFKIHQLKILNFDGLQNIDWITPQHIWFSFVKQH